MTKPKDIGYLKLIYITKHKHYDQTQLLEKFVYLAIIRPGIRFYGKVIHKNEQYKEEKQETMLKIVMIMLCGIGTGYLLRNKKMSFIGRIITVLIWVLLFLLGIEVGSNPRIISGLQTLGLEAIALTFGGSLGSALFAWALWKYVTAKQAKSSAHAETGKGGKA